MNRYAMDFAEAPRTDVSDMNGLLARSNCVYCVLLRCHEDLLRPQAKWRCCQQVRYSRRGKCRGGAISQSLLIGQDPVPGGVSVGALHRRCEKNATEA